MLAIGKLISQNTHRKILRANHDKLINMETKFYVARKGGIHVKDAGGDSIYDLLEGTKEKGPWYYSKQFPDHYIKMWKDRAEIEFV